MTERTLCHACGTLLDPDWSECRWCKCQARRRAESRAASKRRRENPRALAGVDVDRAVAWMLTLPVFADRIPKRKRGRKLRVEVGHSTQSTETWFYSRGTAWSHSFRIRVVAGDVPEGKLARCQARVLEVCLHELCHVAAPPREQHGETFRRIFRSAIRQAWGIEIDIDVDRDGRDNRSYKMGDHLVDALAPKIEAGEVDVFPPRAKTATPRSELSAKLVEKRAAHAAKMLARAERRLKLAKTVQKRWAAKVRYYDRQAAKR